MLRESFKCFLMLFVFENLHKFKIKVRLVLVIHIIIVPGILYFMIHSINNNIIYIFYIGIMKTIFVYRSMHTNRRSYK